MNTAAPRADAPHFLEAEQRGGRKIASVAAGAVLVAAVVLAACFVESGLLASLGIIAVLASTPLAPWLTVLYFGLALGLGSPMSMEPMVTVGGYRFYGADIALALLVWMGLYAGRELLFKPDDAPRRSREEWRLIILLAVFSVYGICQLLYGLSVKNYPVNEAFGMYRRVFFYLTAFFVPAFIPLGERHLRAIKYAITLGGCIVIILGLYRLVTGQVWRADVDNVTGHVISRNLADVEALSLSMVLAYLTAVLRARTSPVKRAAALAIMIAAGILMVLSGWRFAILFVVAAPAAAIVFMIWARRQPFTNVFKIGFWVVLIAVPIALMTPLLFPKHYNKLLLDLKVRRQTKRITGDYRPYVWKAAYDFWKPNPVLGKGLGHRFHVIFRAQDGQFGYYEGSVHNTPLYIAYQTGAVGFVLFIFFHGCFVLYVYRRGRSLPDRYKPLLTGLMTGYACVMASSLFEPVRVAQYVSLYLTMGFVVCLCRMANLPPEARPYWQPAEPSV